MQTRNLSVRWRQVKFALNMVSVMSMRYFECLNAGWFRNHTGIVPMVAVVLLLCLPSILDADNQGSSLDGKGPSPSQAQGGESAARHAGCKSQGEPDKTTSQGACIIDLKPGDIRLFEPSVSTTGKLHRWLDLQAASIGTHYLFAKNGLGVTTANRQQYQVALVGRFKFDAKGRFSINAGLYTGANFIAGSNNTGFGDGRAQSNLYLKHLYLSARPLDGVEIQYGGLNIWHDESTDITGYAYDGYIAGERISIQRPRNLFFDDISIGFGYVGDLTTPSVATRLHRLAQSNFHRFILKKNIGERTWTSVDYTFQSGIQTWREAIRMRATELRVIDTFHAEIYEISGLHSGSGFAAYGEKTILPKFIAGGGYTDIDRLILNSDRYGRGKRLFLTTKIPINKAFSVVMFATQATTHAPTNAPQQRIDIGLFYNMLYHLRKTGLF
jgi:hypothetical protein